MSSPPKDAGTSHSRLLSAQDAGEAGGGSGTSSNPQSRRTSSSRPGIDRPLSTNTIAALRDQFEQYGSPPKIPNIPPRASGTATEDITPAQFATPETAAGSTSTDKQRLDAVSHALSTSPGTDYFAKQGTVAASGTSTPGPSGNPATSIEELTDAQKAMIVGRHLVDKEGQQKARRESQNPDQDSRNGIADMLKNVLFNRKKDGEEDTEQAENTQGEGGPVISEPQDFPMPFGLQGGDVTHDLYKWQRNALANAPNNPMNLKRSKSAGQLSNLGNDSSASAFNADDGDESHDDVDDPTFDIKKIRTPGGFRRNYINRKQADNGSAIGRDSPLPQRPQHHRATSSFVDFLSLYGHFGGLDLEEIDESEEDKLQEEEALEEAERGIPEGTLASRHADERTPLLKRTDTRARIARKRASMADQRGEATVTQAVLMLLKSFVGTGILFLGRAFFNGGMVFSIVVLLSVAMISLYCFLLLVKTRLVVPGSFGDMGGVLYGPWLRIAILTSITLSQIGFVAAYTIFVAENLVAFILAVTDCRVYIPVALMIFSQILVYLPLAMFRNIHKLSGTALVADAFILIGIVYIFSEEIIQLKNHGLGDIVLFNEKNFPLLIGTAVFSFEGVGLVIPITEAMKEPERFPAVLSGVMIFVALLFGGAGALGYAAYGKDISTVVLVNLPQENRFVNVVQFLYSIAIMLSTPLQLFPAVRIMEQGIFDVKSGKYSNRVKWQKNIFRSLTVLGCALISWAGARDLDKFVSLIGSSACVPLCFCYPPLLHLKAVAKTRKARALDITLITFGVVMAVYTTVQTVIMLMNGNAGGAPPNYGKCKPPV